MDQFKIFSVIGIANVVVYLVIAIIATILVTSCSTIINESLYRTILVMTTDYIGRKFTILFPLIYTLFYLILFSNLIGLVPYSSTPTVEIIITLSIALTLLIAVLLRGFLSNGVVLLAAFIPAGTPLALVPLMIVLELVAYVTRTISLGLRLAVNMITGHILAKVCVGFIWVGYMKGTSIFVALPLLLPLSLFLALEIVIAYLQGYIFTFITCITIKDMAITRINW